MIEARDPEYLAAVRAFAAKVDKTANLEEMLARLERIAGTGGKVVLYRDFAPHSFEWQAVSAKGEAFMTGGLIFHGKHDGGGNGGAPTYAVSLEPVVGWSIHS